MDYENKHVETNKWQTNSKAWCNKSLFFRWRMKNFSQLLVITPIAKEHLLSWLKLLLVIEATHWPREHRVHEELPSAHGRHEHELLYGGTRSQWSTAQGIYTTQALPFNKKHLDGPWYPNRRINFRNSSEILGCNVELWIADEQLQPGIHDSGHVPRPSGQPPDRQDASG